MIHFKDLKNKSALSTRWAQMSKQEQIIEKKKMEIQAKSEAQKQAALLAAHAKLTNPGAQEDQQSANIFSNDGSFMSQYKALLEKQKQDKEREELARQLIEAEQKKSVMQHATDQLKSPENVDDTNNQNYDEDRPSWDDIQRWTERGQNCPHSPIMPIPEEKNKQDKSIPSLMQIPIRHPDDQSSDSIDHNKWQYQGPDSNDEDDEQINSTGQRNMQNMGQGPMPPFPPMGPGLLGPGPMGHGQNPSMGTGQNMGPNSGSGSMGPNPGMGHGGPNMPPGPMLPFMGGPPNYPMPPHFMGPNGPRGGPLPPNMCGPRGPGPNGPMPPFFRPPFHGPPMMGPNCPPNSMMGPNCPPNPMIGPNGPPNSMMGPNGPPNSMMGPNGPSNSMMDPNGPPNSMMGSNGPPNSMMGPNGPPNSMMGPNGPPNPMMGPNGPPNPMMGPNGPPNLMMGPNGPSNSMMGPNGPPHSMLGPNGPPNSMMGPNGPPNSMMGPNGPPNSMMGPHGPPNSMMGPNRPPNSMMGPNGPHNSMMGPNGPPNSMMGRNGPPNNIMPPNSNKGNMSFMGPCPPFVPNCQGNAPPKMPFMPPTPMPPNTMPLNSIPEPKPLDTISIPPPEPMKLQNIPSPMPLPLNHIPKPKDLDPGNIPPPNATQVLSTDAQAPPAVQRAAAEVAVNGDHWENVLKAIHSQDQNMWFLHNPNSSEYKAFRGLVEQKRRENKPEVNPEDKYEPEFCLDDDSYDSKPAFKEESKDSYGDSNSQPMWNQHQNSFKREASSQSDDETETKRERRKRKKSRWGADPPSDINPPGLISLGDIKPPGFLGDVKPPGFMSLGDVKPPGLMSPGMMLPGDIQQPGLMMPLPPRMPGAQLAKIDEEGLKLTALNRNNHALMQYAMTNFGTTNLSSEDWKKCEDNFKLNLLYQDMLKKRQQVERLAAAGKNKYEYDSDEDTSEGTWEHRLRAKEMYATEKWADELTKQATGKHHIGDFLPPEELKKFMEKYSAAKNGKEPDLSDYKEFKLKEDNVGFKMLQKLGWNEGQGLGAEGTGIVDPVNKANQPMANLGLGAASGDLVTGDDDEFDAYRKRMMLAYRFRPNPLNNPRRPYY